MTGLRSASEAGAPHFRNFKYGLMSITQLVAHRFTPFVWLLQINAPVDRTSINQFSHKFSFQKVHIDTPLNAPAGRTPLQNFHYSFTFEILLLARGQAPFNILVGKSWVADLSCLLVICGRKRFKQPTNTFHSHPKAMLKSSTIVCISIPAKTMNLKTPLKFSL